MQERVFDRYQIESSLVVNVDDLSFQFHVSMSFVLIKLSLSTHL